MAALVSGIVVGGASSRMGRPKGLLPPPDGSASTLVERLARVIEEANLPRPFLVGAHSAYEHLGYSSLEDAAPGAGPLAGVVSALREAARTGAVGAVVVACDLPFVDASLVQRLATEPAPSGVLCPFVDGFFQPLFARYEVGVLESFERDLKAQKLSFQPLLRELGASRLALDERERQLLVDWDSPDDLLG